MSIAALDSWADFLDPKWREVSGGIPESFDERFLPARS